MIRLILFFHFFLVSLFSMRAQEWQWAKNFDFEFTETQSSIGGVDKEGNIYLTLLNISDVKHQPGGAYRLIKLDPLGNMIWSKDIGEYSQGRIATDENGNSYMCYSDKIVCIDREGSENWKVDAYGSQKFGSIYLNNKDLFVSGREIRGEDSSVAFVSNYSLSGAFLNINYYDVTKFAKGTIDRDKQPIFLFDEHPDPTTGNKGRVLKYQTSGTIDFKIDIPYSDQIIVDHFKNVYIQGKYYYQTITIGTQHFSSPDAVKQFIIKLNQSGHLLWYKIIEGGSFGNSRLTCDDSGNLYYALQYSKGIKIDSEIEENSTSDGNFMLFKWDAEGKLQGTLRVNGNYTPNSGGFISPQSLVHFKGDLLLSGPIKGNVRFGNTSIQTSNDMYSELFVGKISLQNLVGLSEARKTYSPWQVSPNPSDDIFSLRGETDKAVDFSVTNTQGQLILSGSFKGAHQNIDLSAFAPGVYLLQIKSGESIETRKLVKN